MSTRNSLNLVVVVVSLCRTEGAGEFVSVERDRSAATTSADDLSVLAVRHVSLTSCSVIFLGVVWSVATVSLQIVGKEFVSEGILSVDHLVRI